MVWARSNGAIRKNWPFFFQHSGGGPRHARKKRAALPVIWVYLCDACRRGESRAAWQSADWSLRSNHDEQRAENRLAASDRLVCDAGGTFTCQRARPASEGKSTTSQVRRESALNDEIQKQTAAVNPLLYGPKRPLLPLWEDFFL